ncbi:hypothetical protein Halru_0519 [Halovivax ruber XH-70]|uniref:Geranylgeranyl pyrophosphate synthase n=1 Tax=Halovivax ruber (strain DSM 18193 / JCM 13892 / XH-70) TaxID=797302 RepID=L0I8L3_HALRX|nr:hypothetical protein [Halovivax ruber]AGB15153.1 hypothetical protein Halru_0519 [Halovivax ruber XH-70]
MDRVARCRRTVREAVADVSPPPLRRRLYDEIDANALTPAVLTVESALAADPSTDPAAVRELAAGTQLIYDGLALTRELAHETPWSDAEVDAGVDTHAGDDADTHADTDVTAEADADADLAIVAADVLVARGFSLLSRTDAADRAVETIQAFGRDQTTRRDAADPDAIDARLERDVLELAVETGAAAVAKPPSPALSDLAATLADRADTTFPPAERWLHASDATTVDGLASDGGAADHVTEGIE